MHGQDRGSGVGMRVLMGFVAALALTAGLFGSAIAQTTPSPITAHYRAYLAALAQGDYAAAEASADAALAASDARDGDGGRTAVLALNLAMVRLLGESDAEAVAPAERALAIAERTGEASGVQLSLARLIVAHSHFAAAPNEAVVAPLFAALDASAQARDSEDAIYGAALDLAFWTFTQERYEESRRAWAVVGEFAEGSLYGPEYARGRARMGEGAAIMLGELRRNGRTRRARLNEEIAVEAHAAFDEGVRLLTPLAEIETPTGELSIAQSALAEALAWRGVLRAKMGSDGQDIPESAEAQGDADGFFEMASAAIDPRPRCLITKTSGDVPRFPPAAQEAGLIGAVVVRLRVEENGEVSESGVVSAVGSSLFVSAVERVNHRWGVERREDSPTNCRMAMTVFIPVLFML